MNPVEIRKMPVKSSLNTQEIVGSWFPSGYYGHFRAKSRVDLCNSFRQLARPNPPKKFLKRQNSEATAHMFSQHDNRFKFENDPLVRGTQAGFGKRKPQTNLRGEFDPFFIGWIPKTIDRKNYIDDIKTTSYANDYSGNFISSQILSDIQSITSSPSSDVSFYSSVYNHGQPDEQQAKQIRQENFQRYSTKQTRRSQLQYHDRSSNVASCLVWNNTNNQNKTTKTDDKISNILVPITLKSHDNVHRMPIINQPYQSQSMPMFKNMQQSGFGVTSPREYDDDKIIPLHQTNTSLQQTPATSVECLISKYM